MADDQDPTFGTPSARAGAPAGPGARSAPGETARLRQRGEEIRRDGEALARDLGALIGDLEDTWGERAALHPYAVIGGCLAVGYVLGGGLPAGFLRLAASMTGRMAVASLARGAFTSATGRG